jgi:precorrin-6A/cobalt-precorrin-6A reductase
MPLQPHSPRILILGGTSEAAQLATMLAASELTVVSSLAGRLSQPQLPNGAVRIGGFGGVEGLISYLRAEAIRAVVDMTHPFAARISKNAEQACGALHIPLLAFERPRWVPVQGDRWTHVADMPAAASLIRRHSSRIFLSIGRQEIGAFASCEVPWFLIRAIDQPTAPLPPRSRVILDRGPFDLVSELKLLREQALDLLITKESGGAATYPKLEAARTCGIPVILIDRPAKHTISTISDLGDLANTLRQMFESTPIERNTDPR